MASYYTYGSIPGAEDYGDAMGGLGSFAPRGEVISGLPFAMPDEDRSYVPRGEDVPVTPLASLSEAPSLTPRGEDVPVTPLASLPEAPSLTPRGEDVPVAPLSSTVDFIRSQLGEQPQAPSSPLTDTAAAAPNMGDWTVLSEKATAEFINSLSAEDRQALLDADMAGMARGSPLKESPLALNFSGAGFGGTYSLSPQALFTEGTGGSDLETGSLYSPLSSPSIERGKELQKQREAFVTSKAGEMPGAADLKKAAEAMQAQAQKEISSEQEKYLSTLPQRRELSSLLKQGKFSEAFKYAADNGVTELITNPAELKNLRGAFTKDELGKFFSSMPEDLKPIFAPSGLQDEKFNFDPQKGVEYSVGQWRGETGFPLVSSAFMAKKDRTVENLAKIAGAAMLTAGFAPGLLGGAGAGGATGGAGAAGSAGAGAAGAGAGALAPVVPAGVLPGSTAAALGGGLKTFVIPGTAAASGLGGLGAAALGAGTLAAMAPTNAQIASQLQAAGYQPTQVPGTAPATTTPPVDGLEEIVVTGTKPGISQLIPPLTAAQVLQQTLPDLTQGYQPTQIGPDRTEIPPGDGLEEVVVQTSKVPQGGLIDALTAAQIAQSGQELTKDILKDYKPTKVPESPLDKLGRLLSGADKINDLMKLLGTLGALKAGSKAPSGGGAAAPTGFGGALPKYQFQRTQLQPQIDYYRYGLGPEAKFFEDTVVAPKDAEDTMVVGPKDKPPIFKSGGLTGYAKGGDSSPQYVAGPGSGRDDKIPALLSDGEYVIDAETLALLGDGSTKEGAKRMDQFRANIRRHKGRALSRGRISPNAKSPNKYMGGGLT